MLVWLSSLKRVLVSTNNHREINTRHVIFIPWFDQVTLAYFHVVASQWTRVALNPFQMINLNTTAFFLIVFLPFARNPHKLEPLALTIKITTKAQE